MARGERRRFSPVGGAGLVEDVANVGRDGPDGDDQFLGDLPVGLTLGDEPDNVRLPLGEAGWVGRRSAAGRWNLVLKLCQLLQQWSHAQFASRDQNFVDQCLRKFMVSVSAPLQQRSRIQQTQPRQVGPITGFAANIYSCLEVLYRSV